MANNSDLIFILNIVHILTEGDIVINLLQALNVNCKRAAALVQENTF